MVEPPSNNPTQIFRVLSKLPRLFPKSIYSTPLVVTITIKAIMLKILATIRIIYFTWYHAGTTIPRAHIKKVHFWQLNFRYTR